jgi:hypothetical protein
VNIAFPMRVTQYDGRYYDLKVFECDSVEKVFLYEYFAAENDDPLYGGNNEYAQLRHKYKSRFKYMNGIFLEIEKCEFWDKKE